MRAFPNYQQQKRKSWKTGKSFKKSTQITSRESKSFRIQGQTTASAFFIISQKDGSARFISSQQNQRFEQTILKLEGLAMGHHWTLIWAITHWVDLESRKVPYAIFLSWSKYDCQMLVIGLIVKHDVFQEKMSDLMSDHLLYVRGANCFTNRSLTDPQILEKALMRSKSAGYKLVLESHSWQKQP